MDTRWFWSELELAPTQDAREIRRAYATRLKRTHPEDDPDGFQRLHAAYQLALGWAGDRSRQHEPSMPTASAAKREADATARPAASTPATPAASAATPVHDDRTAADSLIFRLQSALDSEGDAAAADLLLRYLEDALSISFGTRALLEEHLLRLTALPNPPVQLLATAFHLFGWADVRHPRRHTHGWEFARAAEIHAAVSAWRSLAERHQRSLRQPRDHDSVTAIVAGLLGFRSAPQTRWQRLRMSTDRLAARDLIAELDREYGPPWTYLLDQQNVAAWRAFAAKAEPGLLTALVMVLPGFLTAFLVGREIADWWPPAKPIATHPGAVLVGAVLTTAIWFIALDLLWAGLERMRTVALPSLIRLGRRLERPPALVGRWLAYAITCGIASWWAPHWTLGWLGVFGTWLLISMQWGFAQTSQSLRFFALALVIPAWVLARYTSTDLGTVTARAALVGLLVFSALWLFGSGVRWLKPRLAPIATRAIELHRTARRAPHRSGLVWGGLALATALATIDHPIIVFPVTILSALELALLLGGRTGVIMFGLGWVPAMLLAEDLAREAGARWALGAFFVLSLAMVATGLAVARFAFEFLFDERRRR